MVKWRRLLAIGLAPRRLTVFRTGRLSLEELELVLLF